jgi:alpha/beta superfamily hydrolase
MSEALRVQFIHGLEGSPQGAKARLFARTFEARTPHMDTSDFEGCVRLQEQTLASFRPDVLVGSSFGGAVAVALLQRSVWTGPTLLLAQAAVKRGLVAALPSDVHVWLVHGRQDAIIDVEDSRLLARSGTPGLVRLIEVDDEHSLHGLVESGKLAGFVRKLHDAARSQKAASEVR